MLKVDIKHVVIRFQICIFDILNTARQDLRFVKFRL